LFDETSSGSGWRFMRKGKVFVAIGGTLAIEAAVQGVDYPDFSSFISAVKANASYSNDSFTTSKGITIKDGGSRIIVEGASDGMSLPVKRIETLSSSGKIANWYGNLSVNKNGKSCTYEFGGGWGYSGNGCGASASPPAELKTCAEWNSSSICCPSGQTCDGSSYYYGTDCIARVCCVGTCQDPSSDPPGNGDTPLDDQTLLSDFNCDNILDVQDLGILMSYWSKTQMLYEYDNYQCNGLGNIDIVHGNGINNDDVSKLFSCWETLCYK